MCIRDSDHCVLYRNDGGWRFTDVTKSAGITGRNTYQAAWADFDRDGDVDLVMGGRLFRNELTAAHWIELHLVGDGKAVCRDGVGAQARISLGKRTLTRHVDAGTGEGNQNSPILHFGLGNHSGTVTVEILWPGGATQTVRARPDRVVTVAYRP